MMFDLHMHTTCSDGKLSPTELVEAARVAKLSHIAITDHDNDDAFRVLADDNANADARSVDLGGLIVISGVEISTRWDNTDIHVLALNYRSGAHSLRALLCEQASKRALRNLKIRDKLHQAGIQLRFEEVDTEANYRLGRVYFAEKMVEAGIVKSADKAFKRYLGKSGRAYVKSSWVDLKTVINVIRAAGGGAVLAHPLKYQISRRKLPSLIEQFRAFAGHGIEVISGKQVSTETVFLANLAQANGLKASLGSDFHASGRPWTALGVAGDLPKTCIPIWDDWEYPAVTPRLLYG